MKRITVLLIAVFAVFTLSACTDANQVTTLEELSSTESLASLSYLSGAFLSTTPDTQVDAPSGLTFLSEEDTTEVETEVDDINVYVDKLKVFMETGVQGFGNITSETSDNELYQYKMTVVVNEETFVLYYNVDPDTFEITGLFIMNGVEYDLTATNSLQDKEELDDDSDDDINDESDNENEDQSDDEIDQEDQESDTEDESQEIEQKMVLIATNGDDSIKITYKYEQEDDELTQKFELEKDIAGVTSELDLKISQEEDSFKVKIEEGENSYEIKRSSDDDEDGTVYKLKYEVNGVEGEIKIIETTNDLGETVYIYQINEDGHNQKTVERHDPDDDDDEEEEQQETEDTNEA